MANLVPAAAAIPDPGPDVAAGTGRGLRLYYFACGDWGLHVPSEVLGLGVVGVLGFFGVLGVLDHYLDDPEPFIVTIQKPPKPPKPQKPIGSRLSNP